MSFILLQILIINQNYRNVLNEHRKTIHGFYDISLQQLRERIKISERKVHGKHVILFKFKLNTNSYYTELSFTIQTF